MSAGRSQVADPIVKLVNLLMREEGEATAIEELDEPDVARPDADTIFVSAEGNQVGPGFTDPEFAPPEFEPAEPASKPAVAPVEEEDEEEMLLEV